MDISDEGLANLCAELRTILADKLVAGNRIERIGALDWPLVVVLSDPFRRSHDPLPEPVRYREINNRSLWKAHFVHLDCAQILACGFGGEE